MADYGVNIAIKFSETKLNKLTKKLNEASKSANKINEAFKKVQQKGGASLDKTNGTLDKKLTRLKNINKELQRENKLLTENASLQRQATRSGRGGGGRPGGGFGGVGRFGQAVLGGGFPLLFGGSPFQAAAGAVGGAFGGFAGGIGLQVVAGQIENLVGRTAEVGQAFNELSFDLDTVAEATGIAGTETQGFLEKIEKYGSKAKAAELATKLLASRVGQEGVNALTKFGQDAATLGNNLSTIFTQVLANIAKVAGPILEFLAKAAGNQAAKQAFDRATGLTGVELAAQKFRAGSMRGQDIKNFAKNLRAAGFEGTLPTSGIQARRISEEIAIRTGKAQMAIPELEIEKIAQTVQAPQEIRDADRVEKDRMKALQDRIDVATKQRDIELKKEASFNRQLNSIGDQNELLRARLEGNVEEAQMQQQINKLVEEYGDDKRDAVELVVKEKFALQEQVKVAEQMKRVYAEIGSTIKSGVVDAISSAVEGTKTLGEVASNVLRNIANRLLDLGVAFGLNALFPGSSLFPNPLTGRASGGGVGAGRPYLVGERGPELFVPGAQGNIVPNNAMGSTSVVVNVDASGTEVQGNQGGAEQLGRLIGSAVQAELIKQKRPGGLLTR
jgi:hypothetical protein